MRPDRPASRLRPFRRFETPVACDEGRSPLEKQRLIRPQYQILAEHHPHREAGPDRQRRLDAHVALRDLLPNLVHRLLCALPPSDDDAVAIGAALWCCQFGPDTQQRGQCSAGQDAVPMPINTIFKPGVAGRVNAGQTVERHR